MPPTGHPTRVEFSTTAKLPLTTESPSSELAMVAGLSKTPGDPAGERRDSSDLQLETLAESAMWPHIPTNDSENKLFYSFDQLVSIPLRCHLELISQSSSYDKSIKIMTEIQLLLYYES